MATHSVPKTDHTPKPAQDDPNELFDLVDEQDRVIGLVRRGDAHRDPSLVHRSVQILVFTSDGRLVLQKRSPVKDLFPGYYCASACGHVASGEDYEPCAVRELREELGIHARLTTLGKALVRSAQETEITTVFAAKSDGPYKFDPSETEGGTILALGQIARAAEVGDLRLTPACRAALVTLNEAAAQHAGGLEGLLRLL